MRDKMLLCHALLTTREIGCLAHPSASGTQPIIAPSRAGQNLADAPPPLGPRCRPVLGQRDEIGEAGEGISLRRGSQRATGRQVPQLRKFRALTLQSTVAATSGAAPVGFCKTQNGPYKCDTVAPSKQVSACCCVPSHLFAVAAGRLSCALLVDTACHNLGGSGSIILCSTGCR